MLIQPPKLQRPTPTQTSEPVKPTAPPVEEEKPKFKLSPPVDLNDDLSDDIDTIMVEFTKREILPYTKHFVDTVDTERPILTAEELDNILSDTDDFEEIVIPDEQNELNELNELPPKSKGRRIKFEDLIPTEPIEPDVTIIPYNQNAEVSEFLPKEDVEKFITQSINRKTGAISVDIKEDEFAKAFVNYNRLQYTNGMYYCPYGAEDPESVEQAIYNTINQVIHKDLSKKTKALLDCVQLEAYVPSFKEDIYIIPFCNGDLTVNKEGTWTFDENTNTPVAYRLPCRFRNFDDTPNTPYFDKWLDDLLEKEDQRTLQEFLGYCFLPTTAAQEALLLLGDAGTGKSVIMTILTEMFGRTMLNASQGLQDFFQDKFMLPELEYKLVLYDDDLATSALKDTGTFKKMITNTSYITASRKFAQPFSFKPYARVIACGNFMLSSLYDQSDGFFRRLHPLNVKPRDPNRVNIRNYEKLVADEIDGIVQWALCGLWRLLRNDFVLSSSVRSRDYISDAKKQAVHFPDFWEDVFEEDLAGDVSSAEITALYGRWCRQNSIIEHSSRSLNNWVSQNAEKLNIKFNKNIKRKGKYARGYSGAKIRDEWRDATDY